MGLGFRDLGFRGLGVWGFRGLGVKGLGGLRTPSLQYNQRSRHPDAPSSHVSKPCLEGQADWCKPGKARIHI